MTHPKGSIQWFLENIPPASVQQPETRPCKRLKLEIKHQHEKKQPSRPHLALRSSNNCQQLLAQELGWRCPPSLNSWHQAREHGLSCISLSAQPTPSGLFWKPQWTTALTSADFPITCLDVQQPPQDDSSSSRLVAAADCAGIVHICQLSRLRDAAASAVIAAAALPPDVREALQDPAQWRRKAASTEGVPAGSGHLPTVAARQTCGSTGLLRVDTQQQLRHCCWLQQQHNGAAGSGSSVGGSLITSSYTGLNRHEFAQGRHATSSLRGKGGSVVEGAGPVVSVDPRAAYQLAAVSGSSLLLWDLRGGPAAAACLPLPSRPAVVRAMPGGTVLLAAEAAGQVSLYDIRRLSSSSIINFGSSRASQQLLLSHNLRAQAQAAGFSSGSVATLYGAVQQEPQFLTDVVVNPVDPNLLAYIKPQWQVGLFDLCSGQVLQQVSCRDKAATATTADGSSSRSSSHAWQPLAHPVRQPRALPLSGCWDSSGRVLYTQGYLLYDAVAAQEAGAGAAAAAAAAAGYGVIEAVSLAAVDFGSWHGRGCRWAAGSSSSSGGGPDAAGAPPDASGSAAATAAAAPSQRGRMGLDDAAVAEGGGSGPSCGGWSGGGGCSRVGAAKCCTGR